jgi:hypothetical protein
MARCGRKVGTVIKQRNYWDCGIAAFANALTITYEEALDAIGRDPEKELPVFQGSTHAGILASEMAFACFKMSKPCYVETFYFYDASESWCKHWDDDFIRIKPSQIEPWLRHNRCIAAVPSLNSNGSEHWLAVVNGKVFDSSTRRVYTSLRGVKILEALIIAA